MRPTRLLGTSAWLGALVAIAACGETAPGADLFADLGQAPSGGQTSGASTGGASGSGGASAEASGAGGVANDGGQAGAGGAAVGGTDDSGGAAGSSSTAGRRATDCAELRAEVRALLREAQACRPSARRACAGFVRDECDCPVAVDDPDSREVRRYSAAVRRLRSRCALACVDVVCSEPNDAVCSSSGRGRPRCAPRGAGGVTP